MQYAGFVDSLAASGTDAWAVHTRALQMKAQGEPVIVLSVGDPDFDTPPGVVEACTRAMQAGATKYSGAGGIKVLLDAISAREEKRLGLPVTSPNIVVTSGAQNALYVTMRCTLEADDEVIILAPPYIMFEGVIRACGAVPVTVPLDAENGFAVDIAALKAAVTPKTKAVLLNSPHNPTGTVANAESVEAVLNICRENDLWLYSDEVYADLCYEKPFTSPYTMEGGPERTVLIRSMSKSHAMSGWRVGWVVGPDQLCIHARNLLNSMQYGGSAFVQHAAAHALNHEDAAEAEMKDAYRRRRDIFMQHLSGLDGISILRPQAGIFCLMDLSALGVSGKSFSEDLLDAQQVSVLAGGAFDPSLEHHVRISFCQPEDVLGEGAERIAAFVRGLQYTSGDDLPTGLPHRNLDDR